MTIHTGLKGQRYGQQQPSHFLDDVIYDELCKIMCYTDLVAEKGDPEEEEEPLVSGWGALSWTPALPRCRC